MVASGGCCCGGAGLGVGHRGHHHRVQDEHAGRQCAGGGPVADGGLRPQVSGAGQAGAGKGEHQQAGAGKVGEVGEQYRDIVRKAADERADLIVMSTHGRTGLEQVMLGSVTAKVVARATCPVLSLRPAR